MMTQSLLNLRVLHMHRVVWPVSNGTSNCFMTSRLVKLKTFTWIDNKNCRENSLPVLQAIAPTIEYLSFDSRNLLFLEAQEILSWDFPHLKEIELRGDFVCSALDACEIRKRAPNLQKFDIGLATGILKDNNKITYVERKWSANLPDSHTSDGLEFIGA